MVHPIIVGYPSEPDFQPTMSGSRDLPLGRMVVAYEATHVQGVRLQKKAVIILRGKGEGGGL